MKLLVEHTYTKRCMYGNVYHTAKITNTKNGKSFTVSTPCLSNIRSILNTCFNYFEISKEIESCTGSARISSLPGTDFYLDECRFNKEWQRALNSIGFRFPKSITEGLK